MLIRIGYDIEFDIAGVTPMEVLLNVHPSQLAKVRQPEFLRVSPETTVSYFTDIYGNTCGRLLAKPGKLRFFNDAIIEDTGQPDAASDKAIQHKLEDLPAETLQFLLASRYCEVDLLKDLAWKLFGDTKPNYTRAKAISTWVNKHIKFGYKHARSTRTAMEGYKEKRGVCRDFMHLAIALTRAMNIPARYATGYLGDIGVPKDVNPMDFSAWYEVYLGGRWWTMDARHDERRIGRVLMARGRDAVDCALTTAFGATCLKKFVVVTEEISG